mmetsp:Transcript_7476/g.19470  ORF Transcript_7476/g.19470 Transcript_7476/m.19470 type:complete len:223 (-) Transcript_7476:369-1037(-)
MMMRETWHRGARAGHRSSRRGLLRSRGGPEDEGGDVKERTARGVRSFVRSSVRPFIQWADATARGRDLILSTVALSAPAARARSASSSTLAWSAEVVMHWRWMALVARKGASSSLSMASRKSRSQEVTKGSSFRLDFFAAGKRSSSAEESVSVTAAASRVATCWRSSSLAIWRSSTCCSRLSTSRSRICWCFSLTMACSSRAARSSLRISDTARRLAERTSM